MNNELMGKCGIDCGWCEFRSKSGCKGCQLLHGEKFWGECLVSKCCMSKKLEHCGKCPDFVCPLPHSFACDKYHGDNGKRLENLRARLT